MINPYWKQNPLFKDLIIAQPFLEGGGASARDLLNGRQEINGEWSSNPYGPCVLFGTDDYVDTNYPSDETNFGNITIMGWAATTSSLTAYQLISGIHYDSDNFFYFGRQGNAFRCECKAGGFYTNATGDAVNHNDGNIHQFVVSSGPSGVLIYYDGKWLATGDFTLGESVTDEKPWLIGSNNTQADPNYNWLGTISLTAFWNRPLSASEIYELYRLGPLMGLQDNSELDASFFGAISQGAPAFNAAWAINSNQVL